jgi:hypothetical protein
MIDGCDSGDLGVDVVKPGQDPKRETPSLGFISQSDYEVRTMDAMTTVEQLFGLVLGREM